MTFDRFSGDFCLTTRFAHNQRVGIVFTTDLMYDNIFDFHESLASSIMIETFYFNFVIAIHPITRRALEIRLLYRHSIVRAFHHFLVLYLNKNT
jgi:hypothetical protein